MVCDGRSDHRRGKLRLNAPRMIRTGLKCKTVGLKRRPRQWAEQVSLAVMGKACQLSTGATGPASKSANSFSTTSMEAPNFYSQISDTPQVIRKWMFEFLQNKPSAYRYSPLHFIRCTVHYSKNPAQAKMSEQLVDGKSRYVFLLTVWF